MAASEARPLQRPAALLVPAALAFLGWTLAFLIRYGAEGVATRMFVDDSFYYLTIAQHAANGAGFSFDALHVTNGFHWLWMLLLVPLAALIRNHEALLAAVFAVEVMLVLLTATLLHATGGIWSDRADRVWPRALPAALWLTLAALRHSFLLSGMETALLGAMGALAVYGFVRVQRGLDAQQLDRVGESALLIGAIGMVLTRIDAAVPAAVMVVALPWHARRASVPNRSRLWLAPALVPAAVGLILLANHAVAGTWLPISALVKRSIQSSLSDHERQVLLLGALAVSIVLAANLLAVVRRATPARRRGLQVLAVAPALYLLTLLVGTRGYSEWYLPFCALACCLAVGSMAEDLNPPIPTALRATVFGALLLVLPVLAGAAHRFVRAPLNTTYLARIELARGIARLSPADCRLAAFNSGQLAYFSRRTVINLDGLVNDRAYWQSVHGRPEALLPYLRENEVQYVVDYAVSDWARPVFASWPKTLKSGQNFHLYTMPNLRPDCRLDALATLRRR